MPYPYLSAARTCRPAPRLPDNPQSLRMRELRVGGIRTVLREAGRANDREAAVFIHATRPHI